MKSNIVLILMIFFIVGHGHSQPVTTKNATGETAQNVLQSSGESVLVFSSAYDGIKGTPYLEDSWSPGSLEMSNGKQYENLEVKYDVMEDNVLVKDETGSPIFLIQGSVRSFQYHDELGTMHIFHNSLISSNTEFMEVIGFFELLHEGSSILYIKRSKYLKHIDSKGAYSSNKSYDEFRDDPPEYFLINEKNELVRFKRGKKSVLTALNDNGNLGDYVKKKKLNLKKDEDIVLLVEYYDSI